MELSAQDSLILLGVLGAAAPARARSEVRIPYPILLVIGGLGLALVPGMPTIELDPELVFVAFLPPLLYARRYFTSLRELRANIGAISLLAFGLVLVTTVVVAWVAHTVIPGLDWPTAFVLGAIVSPTDPTAATAISERVGLPRHLVGLIDGESLLNDATALVAYRVAVITVVSGSFSLAYASAGSSSPSWAGSRSAWRPAGWSARCAARLDDPPLELTISLLTGYVAFLPAQALGVSAVLAAVTVGIYMGWHTPELTNSQTRIQGQALWEIVFFVLNAVLFMLVGLQLPAIVDALSGFSGAELLGWAVLVTVTVTGVRFAWILATARLPGRLRPMGAQSWGAHGARLGGHARRRVARRGARAPVDHRRRHAVPEPRPGHLPDLWRHPRHARLPGADAARADQAL